MKKGQKVRITKNYSKYIGQIGTITVGDEGSLTVWSVEMEDGSIVNPYSPAAMDPECEPAEDINQLPIFN